jgi:type VI secretion system protein ImpH
VNSASPHSGLPSVEERLFTEGYAFDFFQAVRVLERLAPDRQPVGRTGPPGAETVRFRAYLSLGFPPSALYEVNRPTPDLPVPTMVVTFFGLTGPSGILPRHYTELLLGEERDRKGQEKRALRDWLDLFNHRLLALFYRAWEKYRFFIPYARGEFDRADPDPFTRCLLSLVGLGLPPLRNRLRVSRWEPDQEGGHARDLAKIDDLALLHYSGFLSHRPRCAGSLEALLADYFQLPMRVQQFQGQWLVLDPTNQSRLGDPDGNCDLGVNLVAGERVWDVQNKIRVRLGPLRYSRFAEFLPDRAPVSRHKAFFLLVHLVRLYVGPELDIDVQLVLAAEDVPACHLEADADGPRLGWNTWVTSGGFSHDALDAVFDGEEVYEVR